MKEEMSKEQTPITAHEFYNSNTNLTGYELMEQYAKVKVLEALEREFSKVDISMFDEDRSSDYIEQGKFYFETAVKPKYE